MIVPKIVALAVTELEQVIALSGVTQTILPPDPKVECTRSGHAEPHESQSDTVANKISRRLFRQEDVRGDEPGAITNGQLNGGANTSLVVAAEIVVQPDHGDGLRKPAPAAHQVECKVPSTNWNRWRSQKYTVADGGESAAEKNEAEAVLHSIGKDGAGQSDHRGGEIDRNRHVLSPDGSPSQLTKNGWSKE